MEDLQSTALDILRSEHLNLTEKREYLESFKAEAELQKVDTKSLRTQNDLADYIDWIDRQIDSIATNCSSNIVA